MKAFVKCPAYVSLNAVGYLVPRTESPRQRLLLSLVRVRVWAPSVLRQTGLMKKAPKPQIKTFLFLKLLKLEEIFWGQFYVLTEISVWLKTDLDSEWNKAVLLSEWWHRPPALSSCLLLCAFFLLCICWNEAAINLFCGESTACWGSHRKSDGRWFSQREWRRMNDGDWLFHEAALLLFHSLLFMSGDRSHH